MAAFTTSATADASAKTGSSPAYVVDIKEKFAFRVLDNDGDHLASGRVTHLAGERLIAQVSEYLEPNTCIRIDCDDAFLRLSPRLTQTVKTQFAVRCKFLARQDDCTA